MLSSSSSCCRPIISPVSNSNVVENKCPSVRRRVALIRHGACVVRASAVESSSNFAQRMERAWLISQQPRPVICSSCDSNGFVDCKWCSGTGFFILGDNILCQVPSKNTSCVICTGKVITPRSFLLSCHLSINLNYISEQIFPVTELLRVSPPVVFRALYAAQIVKEQVFVQSGWETLRSPTHQFPSSEELYQIHREETASTGKGSRV